MSVNKTEQACDQTPLGGYSRLTVAIVLLSKGFLVWPAIGDWSLYRDDAWQSMAVRVSTWSEVVLSGATAPGFGVLLQLWSKLAGVTTMALQSPAVLCGLAGPVLCYRLCRRLGLARTTAGIAALLLCVSAVHTEQSARVKPYTFDALITIVLMIVALDVSSGNAPRSRWLVLLSLSFIAFTISSTAGIAGAALVGITGVLQTPVPAQRSLAVGGIGAFVAAAASWTAFALPVRNNLALREFWDTQLIKADSGVIATAVMVCERMIQSLTVISPFPHHQPVACVTIAMPILGIAAGFRLLSYRRWSILLSIPVLAALLAATGKIPLGGGRTDLYLAPVYAILSALIVERCLRLRPSSSTRVLIRISATAVVTAAMWRGRAEYPVEDLRELTGQILENTGATDQIIVYPETSYMVSCYVNRRLTLKRDELAMTGFTPAIDDQRFVLLPGFETGKKGPIYQRATQLAVDSVRKMVSERPPRIWVVRSQLFPVTLHMIDEALAAADYRPVQTIRVPNAEAIIWESSR